MSRISMPAVRWLGAAVLATLVSSCVYEAPLTPKPTAKIDDRLLGNWMEQKSDSFPETNLKIRKLDDGNYFISYNGFYRAFHSDLGENHFVSIQNIDSAAEKERKYTIAAYELKDGGDTVVIRALNDKIIPETLKTSAELEKAVR